MQKSEGRMRKLLMVAIGLLGGALMASAFDGKTAHACDPASPVPVYSTSITGPEGDLAFWRGISKLFIESADDTSSKTGSLRGDVGIVVERKKR